MNTCLATHDETNEIPLADRLTGLDAVQPGNAFRIKKLCAGDETACRLREIGLCEGQVIRLIARHSNIICQVCNTRLALNSQLAGMIMVEALAA